MAMNRNLLLYFLNQALGSKTVKLGCVESYHLQTPFNGSYVWAVFDTLNASEITQSKQSDTDHNLLSVRLTFIVVKKQIIIRFFIEKDEGRLDNPSPGIVIDLEVTRTEW